MQSPDNGNISFTQILKQQQIIQIVSVDIMQMNNIWFSLLCKSQGAEPSILRFLFIFFVRPSFLPYETKKLHLQFLAVLFQNL